MDTATVFEPLHALSGLAVGALVGMTGVGGGSLMTPLLILLFGISPATAVGTDLLYASATKSVGAAVHGLRGSVDWHVVGRLALGSIPGTALAIYGLARIGPWNSKIDMLITAVLGVTLFLTTLSLMFRKTVLRMAAARMAGDGEDRTLWLTVLTGFLLGVSVSISSVGAGALGATALIVLYPRHPMAKIVGSDIAHAVPLTLVAGVGHWLLGGVNGMLFASLLAGSVPGIAIGSYVATYVPETVLRVLLAAVLAIAAARLLFL